MQGLFVTTLCAVLLYFGAGRRRYDIFSVAAVSAAIYFIPGLWGVDLRGTPLEPQVYAAMIGVLLALGTYTLLGDRVGLGFGIHLAFAAPATLLNVFAVVALGIFVFILAAYGPAFTFGDKGGVPFPGWVYVFWRVTASLFLLLAFVMRSRWLWVAVPLITSLYLGGDRTGPAMAALAVAIAWMTGKQPGPFWRTVLRGSPVLLFVGVLMLFGDYVFTGIRLWVMGAGVDELRQVARQLEWSTVLRTSEPFVTQMILNEIVRQSFYVGPAHLVGVFYQIWPSPSAFGYPSGIFNELFQPVLFPESRSAIANWGVAYSYWGEALATGGWAMYGVFLTVFLSGLSLLDRLIRSPSAPVSAVGALLGAYWAFYIQRNSLANILTYERHILYLALICAAAALLIPTGRLVFGRVTIRGAQANENS